MKTLGVVSALALVLAATASAALPQRLSKMQWAAYTKAHTAFTTQTPKSVAKFRSCSSASTGSRDARAMQRCMGTTADKELTVTNNLFTVLKRFERKTAGKCASSLANYEKGLYFWRSVITGLNRAIHSNVANIATMEAGAQQARGVYPQVTKAAFAFRTACKPK